MKLHVTSLELSKQLKEAGIKQESEFCWWKNEEDWILSNQRFYPRGCEIYSAFLATELLEMLPQWIPSKNHQEYEYELVVTKENDGKVYVVGYYEPAEHDSTLEFFEDKSLPNALAEMVLWCKKEGHI